MQFPVKIEAYAIARALVLGSSHYTIIKLTDFREFNLNYEPDLIQ